MQKARVLLGANLYADGNKLVGVVNPVYEFVGRHVDLIQVGSVFLEVVAPSHDALPDFAVEVHILGVEPVDFEVKHERVARFAKAANKAFFGAGFFIIGVDAWVEAIGGSDADDLGEAACVGSINGTNVFLQRIIMVAWVITETARRFHAVAEAELVLVAPDGVALREGGHRKGDEQAEDDKFGFHNYLDLNSLLSEMEIIRIMQKQCRLQTVIVGCMTITKIYCPIFHIDELSTNAKVGVTNGIANDELGVKPFH